VQEVEVGALGLAARAVAGTAVELAFVVDALGEAPFAEEAGAVEAPIERLREVLVQVELPHARHAVARIAQGLIVGGQVEGVVLSVVEDVTVAIGSA